MSEPTGYEYPDDAVHGAPTAEELVAAVRQWLTDEVMPSVEGRLAFHARVAANVLGTVERELASAEHDDDAHRRRLDRLGVSTERELAEAIRRGAFDEREAELIEVLRQAAVDRLRVANPRWLHPADR